MPRFPQYVSAHLWHNYPLLDANAREHLKLAVMQAVREAQHTSAWRVLQANPASSLAELNIANVSGPDGRRVLAEGVIDAVCETPDGWLVVDWKLNRSSDVVWQRQLKAYEAQTAAYTSAFEMRTGNRGSVLIERLQGNASS